jgi:hypothetical protein
VLNPLLQGLHVTVEHGGIGVDAEPMGDAVDLEPPVRVRLARVVEELGEALGEDLGAAPRHRVEPRRLEPGQGLARLDLPAPPPVVHLRGREGLDLRLRPGGVDGRDHALEVLEGPVRMVAAHDMGLAGARLDHLEDVLYGVLESALFARLAGEVAEAAREHADIGGVHVTVEHEEDPVPVPAALDVVGHTAEPVKVVRREQGMSVLAREPLAGAHLFPDGLQAGVAEASARAHHGRHVVPPLAFDSTT